MERNKDSKTLQKDIGRKLTRFSAITAMFAFVIVMILLVVETIFNMRNNPINTVMNNLSQSKDMTAAAVSAIEAATSNAISSTTLIITVAGIFITGLSVFAAIIVYITNTKLEDVDKKIDEKLKEVDNKIIECNKRISIESYMRHVSFGIRYWEHELNSYALNEFEQVLVSEDEACRLSVNYYMGLLYSDRFMGNNNPNDFKQAEDHLHCAIQEFKPDIDPIILNDSYASLGCLYGLGAERDFDGAFYDDYLNRSEELLIKAINKFDLAVHYKNLAVTYTLKEDSVNAIKYIEKGIQRDAIEKGIAEREKQKENAANYFEKVFNKEEERLIRDKYPKTYEKIKNHFVLTENSDKITLRV